MARQSKRPFRALPKVLLYVTLFFKAQNQGNLGYGGKAGKGHLGATEVKKERKNCVIKGVCGICIAEGRTKTSAKGQSPP